MRKAFFMLYVFILFISLLGASNSIVPVNTEEKTIPGKSFGAGRGFYGASTDEALEVASQPEIKILSKSVGAGDPLTSCSGPEKGVVLSKVRALSDVIDSLTLPGPWNTGSEWSGRYIYIVKANIADSSEIQVIDPENGGLLVNQWKLPFIGAVMSVAFVNNSVYVSDVTNGMR